MYDRDALMELIRDKALRFGEFTLASGKKASYYLDCRCVTLDSTGANLIAAGMLDLWANENDEWPDAVGGMAVGAVPIASAILSQVGANHPDRRLRGFFVRKEAKEYGAGKQVEGPVESGDKVMIVEDVVTTGGSSIRAIKQCEEFGARDTRRYCDH